MVRSDRTPLTRGPPRAVRGCAFTVVSALLAIAAHVAGSGRPPQTASLVIAVVALAAASSAVADRQRGLLGVLALTGAGQLAVHLVLFGLDGHAPDPRGLPAPGAGHPLVMIVVHVLAAAIVAIVLTGAYASAFAVAAALARVLHRSLVPPPASAPLRSARRDGSRLCCRPRSGLDRSPAAVLPSTRDAVGYSIAPGNASSGRCSAPRPGRRPAESSLPDRPPFANSGVV